MGVELPKRSSEAKEQILRKISRYNLNADVVVDKGNLLLVYIGDVVASTNLGSQEWSISQAKGYGYGENTSKKFIDKKLEPMESSIAYFNHTYQLSKYKRCYFLFDFDYDFPLNKFCFIVGPHGEIEARWDAKDRFINDVVNYILDYYPELNEK